MRVTHPDVIDSHKIIKLVKEVLFQEKNNKINDDVFSWLRFFLQIYNEKIKS